MSPCNEIKGWLSQALTETVDQPMKSSGFARRGNSHIYRRRVGESIHEINLAMECYPTHNPGHDACILPFMHLRMRKLVNAALVIVGGDGTLLAKLPNSTSDLIFCTPIHVTAPKEFQTFWYVVGAEEMARKCGEVQAFLDRWVVPFLDQTITEADLVRHYENKDNRIFWTSQEIIYVATAYRLLGDEKKARDAIQKHFSPPGLKRRFKVLFESFGMQ